MSYLEIANMKSIPKTTLTEDEAKLVLHALIYSAAYRTDETHSDEQEKKEWELINKLRSRGFKPNPTI